MFFNSAEPARQRLDHVITLLKYTYALLFIAVGADKFFNIVTNWDKYFSLVILNVIPVSAITFVYLVGIIEIIIGIFILLPQSTRFGARIAALWLCVVVVNFLTIGTIYLDIAVRDIVMAIGAWSLGSLVEVREKI